MRPFRFALKTAGAANASDWRQLVDKVEGLGYSTLTVADHLDDQWGPLVSLTSALERTNHLRVGALVFANDFRHPALLAKELATLDLLGEGRVEVGLGAGWRHADYTSTGIPFASAPARIDRLAEAVEVLRALWGTEGPVTWNGRYYEVDSLVGMPRPHTAGGPPLVIGGGGRRVLSLAAVQADIVGFNTSLHEGSIGVGAAQSAVADRFDERVGWVKEAAGERFGELELQLNTFTVQVLDDPEPLFEALAPGFGLTVDQARDIPMVLAGSVTAICEQLLERRERYGFSYIVVHEAELDSFAPVVERLAGT